MSANDNDCCTTALALHSRQHCAQFADSVDKQNPCSIYDIGAGTNLNSKNYCGNFSLELKGGAVLLQIKALPEIWSFQTSLTGARCLCPKVCLVWSTAPSSFKNCTYPRFNLPKTNTRSLQHSTNVSQQIYLVSTLTRISNGPTRPSSLLEQIVFKLLSQSFLPTPSSFRNSFARFSATTYTITFEILLTNTSSLVAVNLGNIAANSTMQHSVCKDSSHNFFCVLRRYTFPEHRIFEAPLQALQAL